ncbi:unnamed protein product [Euphydryas editha]|uniref:Uncharacterized protein n=1 Tax=Euphydryas editha TaxID=104508 RepID=A0AAU9U8J0_EUPED|nr:unnamed protein product [Euphydryas editha]
MAEVRCLRTQIEEYEDFILCYMGQTSIQYGVGFLVRKNLKENIESITRFSESVDIFNLHFQEQKFSIIQNLINHYIVKNTSTDVEKITSSKYTLINEKVQPTTKSELITAIKKLENRQKPMFSLTPAPPPLPPCWPQHSRQRPKSKFMERATRENKKGSPISRSEDDVKTITMPKRLQVAQNKTK